MSTGESFRSLAFAIRISQNLSDQLPPILLPTSTQDDMV